MEQLIKAAVEVIADIRRGGDCPACLANFEHGEDHGSIDEKDCPYGVLEVRLKAELIPFSETAHDGKYYVWKIDQDAEPIPADEPVFVLRAQDKYAAITVRHYAQMRPLTVAAHTQIFDIADAMDAWPFHKEPD